MAGDEIIAEFGGDVYSARIITTEAPQRFSDVSLRLKHLLISENTAENSYIGKYIADRATFVANALYLLSTNTVTLHSVDLYNLGCAWGVSGATYALLGTY